MSKNNAVREVSEQLRGLGIDGLRAALSSESETPESVPEGVDRRTMIKALRAEEKVIYGDDDRRDLFQVSDRSELNDIDATVGLVDAGDLTDNGDGTSTLSTVDHGPDNNLCQSEPFFDQPTAPHCSGFIVGPDLIATAGHCVDESDVTDTRFVHGFWMETASNARTTIDNDDIYSGAEIVERSVGTSDWAVVRINERVTDHRYAEVRRAGQIADDRPVHVIGHPSGLPLKFAGGASVRDNSSDVFFVANLDTYGGNSGSAVFDNRTHNVEGILVRGEQDYVRSDEGCLVSNTCPDTSCRGEDCTRTTESADPIADRIGYPVGYTWSVDDTQHLVYRDDEGGLHELWFKRGRGWMLSEDLRDTASDHRAVGDPTGYTWDVDDTQHVVFRDDSGGLHELWFKRGRGWMEGGLNSAQSVDAVGDPCGYTWDVDDTQHVVYLGDDEHVHELWFTRGQGWRHNNLTAATNAPAPLSDPVGYTWDVDNTQHVVYTGTDGHIHELWFTRGQGWRHNDLTHATNATRAIGTPTGYTWDVDDTQHVVYRGEDGRLYELWFTQGPGWRLGDGVTNTAPVRAVGDPVGYTWDVDNTQHIVYRGEDGQLHELWFKRGQGWMEGGVADAMPVDAVGDPTGYTWDVDDTQHVVYRGEDDRLCELWFKRGQGWQVGYRSAGLDGGETGDSVTHEWSTVEYGGSFAAQPAVIADMQTFNGADPAGIRLRHVDGGGFDAMVEEERSGGDDETRHTTEVVGYLAAKRGPITDAGGVRVGESGTVETDQSGSGEWHTVELDGEYTDPVVVAQLMSYNGNHPAHTRLRNVSGGRFDFKIEEWSYLDGAHTAETVGYVVVEAGTHDVDGTVVQAGTVRTDETWASVSVDGALPSRPTATSHCQTHNGGDPVVTRQRRPGSDSIEIRLQEETAGGPHVTERIGYLLTG
jgi:hypothetical protein